MFFACFACLESHVSKSKRDDCILGSVDGLPAVQVVTVACKPMGVQPFVVYVRGVYFFKLMGVYTNFVIIVRVMYGL